MYVELNEARTNYSKNNTDKDKDGNGNGNGREPPVLKHAHHELENHRPEEYVNMGIFWVMLYVVCWMLDD